jgi:hypothetical protein
MHLQLKHLLVPALVLALAGPAGAACSVPDNGTGTIDLPPACPDGWEGPMTIIDGLPAGSTISVAAALNDFSATSESPGGTLAGQLQNFDGNLHMALTGTGSLAGFNRLVALPCTVETHSAPRTPGDPVQSFDTVMFLMQGQITGDPDFDLLRVTAGGGFGMPSPGHTTLTREGAPGTPFAVDSFFDITYRIDFVGAPGGVLGGHSGSTTGTELFQMGGGSVAVETSTFGAVKALY